MTFFYINNFSLGFDSVGAVSRLRAKDIFVIIKPQTGNEAGVLVTSCPEEMAQRI